MGPPTADSRSAIPSLLYTLLFTLISIFTATIQCARRRTATKRVPSTERTARSHERKEVKETERESKEFTARADVWEDYDKKVEKLQKKTESKKEKQSSEEKSKQPTSTPKKVDEKPKQQPQQQPQTAETPFDYSEALKKPPPDVDFNDFVVRAAMAQTVVNPFLVKKVGNIDDEQADPKKVKAQLQQLDEQMKSKEESLEENKKDAAKPPPKGVKWGDTKCVLYETRDQLTLEDDAEDAADLA